MKYQGSKNKFSVDGKLYQNKKGICFDVNCNNEILIPSYGLNPRSKQRFCSKCRNTKNNLRSSIPIVWKCIFDDCDNILMTPENSLNENKCKNCKKRRNSTN
ncbi:hypothetical protein [Nitrosopumilus spindle-shaped virus]|uniref:Uncharacterized protein n=1 Tax=Nitrosopumilus spindle-shaped virus TaxID=2508184 RepID=A0A514K352_9VIRU|nr:hypothetical protein [Nitrosopumilus spindle-shaped virus]